MVQYVTVKINPDSKQVYTYSHSGSAVSRGDEVIVDASYSGVRPAVVVATSKRSPKKKASIDGYKGRTTPTIR